MIIRPDSAIVWDRDMYDTFFESSEHFSMGSGRYNTGFYYMIIEKRSKTVNFFRQFFVRFSSICSFKYDGSLVQLFIMLHRPVNFEISAVACTSQQANLKKHGRWSIINNWTEKLSSLLRKMSDLKIFLSVRFYTIRYDT